MKKIKALAWTTFQELLRERFFVVGIIVALLLVVMSYLLGNISIDEASAILFNLGVFAIEIVTVSLGIFAGARLVSREIELRTCQIILTRPLSRTHFLLGKWFGLLLFILLILLSLSVLIFLLGGEYFQKISYIWIISEIGLKACLVMTVVFLSSLQLRPVLAAFIGISIYFLGHSVEDIKFFIKRGMERGAEPPFISHLLDKLVPRFDLFNWKNSYYLEQVFTQKQIVLMLSHYSVWIFFLLILSLISWRKKDIA